MVLRVCLLSVVTITKLLYARKVDGLSCPEEVFHLASWLTWFLQLLDWGNMKDLIDLPHTMESSYYIYRRRSEWKGWGVGIMNHALPPGIQQKTSKHCGPVVYSSQPRFMFLQIHCAVIEIIYHTDAIFTPQWLKVVRFYSVIILAHYRNVLRNYIGHTTSLYCKICINTADYWNRM